MKNNAETTSNDKTSQLPASARDILAAVESVTGIDIEQLLAPGRRQEVAVARNMAMYLMWRRGFTFSEIGAIFERDQTTCRGNRDSFETAALLDRTQKRRAKLAWQMIHDGGQL